MANNRMYLRCRKCGDAIMLSKTFLTPLNYAGISCSKKEIDSFLSEHAWCYKECKSSHYFAFIEEYPLPPADEVSEENGFDIVYETNCEIKRETISKQEKMKHYSPKVRVLRLINEKTKKTKYFCPNCVIAIEENQPKCHICGYELDWAEKE